ncbi:MAG: GGDEF domain-containing protein [Anaerolineales bacterium]|nr:GGDEF domain-containing protein [Anaerolineales bacterium]
MALVGLAGHSLFIPLFLWLGVWPMAAINVVSCATFGLCYWLNRRGRPHAALLVGTLEVVAHAGLAVAWVGWDSGFHYYIVGLTPLIFYSPAWRLPLKAGLAAVLCAIYVALYWLTLNATPWVNVDGWRNQVAGTVNVITLFIVFAALAAYYRLAAASAEDALQNLNRLLDHQAHTDPLTRIANRRDMEARIKLAVDAHQFSQTPFSVVLCDIDDFKAFNDRYGHDTGDLILVAVAGLLRACLREQDHVARWGGEEFLLFLPGTRQDNAWGVAERIREKIAATRLPIRAQAVAITLTFGVAEYAAECDPAACIKRADTALYQGKQRGKNQVVAADSAARPA